MLYTSVYLEADDCCKQVQDTCERTQDKGPLITRP